MDPPPNFAVVVDGPSPLLSAAVDSLVAEASALFGGPAEAIAVTGGDHTPAVVAGQVTRALSAPGIDAVFVVGPLATAVAAQQAALNRPTVALLGAPLAAHGVAAADPRRLIGRGAGLLQAADLVRLRQLAPAVRRVVVPVSAAVERALPQLRSELAEQAAPHGLSAEILVVSPQASANPLSGLSGADAVVLALPGDPAAVGTERLLRAAAAKRLPVVAGLSAEDVARGALLSSQWTQQQRLWARAAALGMQGLLEGAAPRSLRAQEMPEAPASSRGGQATGRLLLNVHVAQALGLSPSYELLLDAELVDNDADEADTVSLQTAVRRALQANLSLRAARYGLAAGEARVRRVRAPLLPQASLSADAIWIDQDRGAGPFPPAERTLTVSGAVQQTLYSARRFGDYGVADEQQRARLGQYNAVKLDLVREVALRYIELMRARDLERVQRRNLHSARINLALAQGRKAAGEVAREEVYRWRIALSSAQQEVARAAANRRKAEAGLNELRSVTPARPLQPAEAHGSALAMLATHPGLGRYFEGPDGLDRLSSFAVDRALASTPELRAARSELAAAERAQTREERAFFLPELALRASLGRRLWTDGAGSGPPASLPGLVVPDRTDWSLGLFASLPLFSGLGDQAAVDEASAEAARKRAELGALALAIERRVHSALLDASAAHQAKRLAAEAAQAARENLSLVRDGYARGSVDVLRLVDAQGQVIATELAEQNAYHDFLSAFVQVEREIGAFSFGPSSMAPGAFLRELSRANPPQTIPTVPTPTESTHAAESPTQHPRWRAAAR